MAAQHSSRSTEMFRHSSNDDQESGGSAAVQKTQLLFLTICPFIYPIHPFNLLCIVCTCACVCVYVYECLTAPHSLCIYLLFVCAQSRILSSLCVYIYLPYV